MTQLMEQAFENAKEQISKGIIPEVLKQIGKQMLEVQSDMLGFDVREIVSEEEVIARGWSKEYLEDECFSEDFGKQSCITIHTHPKKKVRRLMI